MLIQFSVSNFCSIRDEVTLSMMADKDQEHEEILIPFRKERILPNVAMYGANAAGKTNIIRAITAAVLTIRESNQKQITDQLGHMIPFLFDDQKKNEPCKFDFIFTVGDVKYMYGFTADITKVYEEYLYAYKSAKPSMIFERSNVSEYKFIQADRREFMEYAEKNTDNKLFLATATAWNCQKTKEAFQWFAKGIDTYNNEGLEAQMQPILADDPDGSIQEYVTSMLHTADINVSGYSVRSSNLTLEDLKGNPIVGSFIHQISNGNANNFKKYEITTEHEIKSENGNKKYDLPFQFESEGTRRFVYISPIIKKALETGQTIIIDEIDASLHPFLVDYILSIFSDREQNPLGSQLIVTTQDVSLLSLNRFRRDQIYFVEKDNKTGVSDLYSLDEFAPRKNADIRKGYLQGRYGAIPVIGEGAIEW